MLNTVAFALFLAGLLLSIISLAKTIRHRQNILSCKRIFIVCCSCLIFLLIVFALLNLVGFKIPSLNRAIESQLAFDAACVLLLIAIAINGYRLFSKKYSRLRAKTSRKLTKIEVVKMSLFIIIPVIIFGPLFCYQVTLLNNSKMRLSFRACAPGTICLDNGPSFAVTGDGCYNIEIGGHGNQIKTGTSMTYEEFKENPFDGYQIEQAKGYTVISKDDAPICNIENFYPIEKISVYAQ